LELLDQESGRNGHDAVGDEERKRQHGHEREAQVEIIDDLGNQRADDVRQKRDDKEGQEDEADDIMASANWRTLVSGV
jgi:hypothetical protein